MRKLQRRPRRFKGQTLGLDLHTKVMQYSLLDPRGDERANEKVKACPEVLAHLVDQLTDQGQKLQVVLEASGCFIWAFDLLVEKLGREQVHVAAPSRVRVIADSMEKNDANDAWWLAYLLYEGRLPEAFVAEGDLRELRIACREHRSVVHERSDLMRRLRSHMQQTGRPLPKNAFNSRTGREATQQMVQALYEQGGMRGLATHQLWERIQELDEHVAGWRKQVEKLSARFEEVKAMAQNVPGLGPVTAAVVWSELGDPQRYKQASAYAKGTGTTPGYRESAGKRQGKKITRQGSAYARWALTMAAKATLRSRRGAGVSVGRWIERVAQRRGKKAAIVAAARKLAEGIWRLFELGQAFDPTRAFGVPAT